MWYRLFIYLYFDVQGLNTLSPAASSAPVSLLCLGPNTPRFPYTTEFICKSEHEKNVSLCLAPLSHSEILDRMSVLIIVILNTRVTISSTQGQWVCLWINCDSWNVMSCTRSRQCCVVTLRVTDSPAAVWVPETLLLLHVYLPCVLCSWIRSSKWIFLLGSHGRAAVSHEWTRLSSRQSTESRIKPNTCRFSARPLPREWKVDWESVQSDESQSGDCSGSVCRSTSTRLYEAIRHRDPDLASLDRRQKRESERLFL